MTDGVEVKFGAETSGLDQGTEKAVADLDKFEKATQALINKLEQMHRSTTEGFIDVENAIRGPQQAMDQTKNKAGELSTALGGAAQAFLAYFSVRAVVGWIQQVSSATEHLVNLSQQLGITATDLSALQVVSENAGLGAEGFTRSIQIMDRNLAGAKEGSKEQSEAFAAIGINATTATGNMDLFLQVAQKFSTIPDGPEKTALAMKLLGRSGAELIPIFNQGSDAISDTMKKAQDSGAAMSEQMIASGLEVDTALDEMGNSVSSLGNELFTALAPAITTVVNGISGWVKDMQGGEGEVTEFTSIVGALSLALKALGVVGGFIGTLITDVVVASTIVAIGAISLLRATVISLAKALTGDFGGALDVWTSETDKAVKAVEAQLDHAMKVNKDYGKFLDNLANDKPAPATAAAPGAVNPAGQAILDNLARQQAASAKAAADAETQRKKAAADAVARAKQQAEREVAASAIEGLNNQQDVVKNNFDQWMELENKKLAIIKTTYGEQSRQYQQLLGEQAAAERAHQQELQAVRQIDEAADRDAYTRKLTAQHDADATSIDIERSHIAAMADLGQISNSERILREQALDQRVLDMNMQLENQLYDIQLAGLRSQLTVLTMSATERAKVNAEIERLEAEHQGRMLALTTGHAADVTRSNDAAAQAAQQSWLSITQPVATGLNGMFQSLYNGTATFRDSLLQAMDQILFGFVNMGLQMAAQWAANQLAQTAATTAGVATRTGVEAAGAATSQAISAETALFQIANFAWTAAAGAFAALAGIPIVGPVLAAGAAAAAVGAVLAFAGNIFSAEGGWGQVPKGGAVTKLHEDEMVLPAQFASPLRDMLTGWGPSSSPASLGGTASALGVQATLGKNVAVKEGDVNLHYAPQTNVNNVSLEQLLRRDGNAMKRWLANETRNGNLTPGKAKANS